MSNEVLSFIKRCISQGKIVWTYHVNMRLEGRGISRTQLLEAVDSYDIIEEYQHDKYLPSYLVHACHGDEVFHVQIAVDKENDNVRVVTAYKPAQDKWEPGFKRRKIS